MNKHGDNSFTRQARSLDAANEEFVPARRETRVPPDTPCEKSGWDPYEVWRTRVRHVRDEAAYRDPI